VCTGGFKYPIVSINPSFGLLSGTDSNRQSNPEIVLAADGCTGNGYTGRSDNAFFIDPYVDKRNERRDRTRTHHNNVLKVFQNWRIIQLRRVATIDGLYKTCIPLYFDVVSSLHWYDKYNEGIVHLPNYPGPYDIVLNIISLENEHNRTTSQFMAEREKGIKKAISDNENISIKEWKTSDDTYPWYKLAKIFEHLQGESYQHMERRIEPYTDYGGKHYYKLFRNPADFIAVAEEINLQNLRDLIDSVAKTTVSRLREITENIDKMQNFLNGFSEGIDNILHQVSTRGLKGRCHEEQELRVPAILRGRVMRFFRRRLLRNPPV